MKIQGVKLQGTKLVPSGAAVVDSDTYFNLVTLLLPGNGTNGAQNNTFLDSSTNAFTVTRNGNTTQGTFSPFSQTGWSGYFDGSGDYLSTPNAAALRLGAGDFTVEAWIYPNRLTNTYDQGICGTYGYVSTQDRGWLLSLGPAGYLQLIMYGSAGAGFTLTSSTLTTINTWSHVAATRSGTTVRLFLNGVQVASGTSSKDEDYTVVDFNVATSRADNLSPATGNPGTSFQGSISNLRLVKGTAVYTSAFTPPTAPLTAISGTSILTCQSNRFIDNSTNAFAITAAGNTAVQAFAPFDPTAAYAAATVGGSGYFDGSDYLTAPQSTAFDLSGDFTVECWVYFNSVATTALVGKWGGSGSYAWILQYDTGTGLRFYTGISGGLGTGISGAWTPVANIWYHVAATRSSNSVRLFVNGTQVGTTTTNSDNCTTTNQALNIGRNADTNIQYLTGYLAGLRVVKGTAVYTSAFTPPTAPPTAIANTSLLLNYTNAGITDATAKNVLETVGSAQISTTQSKFGGSSMSFDGNGDGLFVPYSSILAFGTGNFTIEFWLRFNSISGYQSIISFGYVNQVANGWLIQTGLGDGKMNFYRTNASDVTLIAADNGSNSNINQWYHIAIVRKDTSNFYIYRDGNAVGTSSDSSNYNPSTLANFYIGGGSHTGFNNYYLNGYINDLRITRGYARYTANFTPPTTAFPTQ